MAMVKNRGRSSQRTAALSHTFRPGWGGEGAGDRARVANLQDEGDEPGGVPGVRLVLRIGAPQYPFLEVSADQLSAEENSEHHRVRAQQGWHDQAEAGDDLPEVDRMADQPVGTAGDQAARLEHDAEASPEGTQRVQSPGDADREADVASGQHRDGGAAAPVRNEKEAVEDETANHGG